MWVQWRQLRKKWRWPKEGQENPSTLLHASIHETQGLQQLENWTPISKAQTWLSEVAKCSPRPLMKCESEVTQSCPTLSDPMDCSLPGSSAHEVFQARVLEWGATAFSKFGTTYKKGNVSWNCKLRLGTENCKNYCHEQLCPNICIKNLDWPLAWFLAAI